MKRKITKASIEELRKEMPVLNEEEEQSIVGGERIRISGGYLESVDGGTYFYGDNGSTVFFKGVDFSIDSKLIADYSAYQFNGTIHVEEKWAYNGFDIYVFAHEYGHYLQQEEMGFWNYLTDVAIPSMYSAQHNDPYTHSQQPFEKDATKRGEEYLNKNTN